MTMLKYFGNLHDKFSWCIIQWKLSNFSLLILFVIRVTISQLFPMIEGHPSVHIETNFCQSILFFQNNPCYMFGLSSVFY